MTAPERNPSGRVHTDACRSDRCPCYLQGQADQHAYDLDDAAPRRDLAPAPRFARGLPIDRIRRFGVRRVGRRTVDREALAAEIEEVVAEHLMAERGSVRETERRAARLAAEIALRVDR